MSLHPAQVFVKSVIKFHSVITPKGEAIKSPPAPTPKKKQKEKKVKGLFCKAQEYLRDI